MSFTSISLLYPKTSLSFLHKSPFLPLSLQPIFTDPSFSLTLSLFLTLSISADAKHFICRFIDSLLRKSGWGFLVFDEIGLQRQVRVKRESFTVRMAPSFDCTGLLCAEDSLLCLDESDIGDDDFNDGFIVSKDVITNQNHNFFNGDEDFSLTGFPLLSEECIVLMVEGESDHLPRDDYLIRLRNGDLDLKIRREAIDWIGKVQARYNFGPLCAYLSVNYMDRFLSAYELPRGKAWMMQLLAVACLSLAAKVEETDVPLCLDLQVCESKFVFEAKTIQRMELLVLSTLKWRMQPITPFSFIDYFLWKINYDQRPPKSSITRSIELISNTSKGIDFLEFRPSEIAAAVAMFVSRETQTVFDIDKAVACFIQYVKKERVLKCFQLMKDVSSSASIPCCISGIVKVGNSSSLLPSVPRSPIGVLDAACLSYKSDELTVGSCANSSHSPHAVKRRKLNNSNPYEVVDLKS